MEGREEMGANNSAFLGKMRAVLWSISICLAVAAAAHASSLEAAVPEKSSGHVLKPPDFYRFAVQYSRSVCEKKECGQKTRANLPTEFSIHGLWEGMNDKNKEAPITSKEEFDVNRLAEVRRELDRHWFDALKFDKPEEYPKFWEHEWEQHGKRSGLHLRDYFETTVRPLYGEFGREFDALVTRDNKYLPGREFDLNGFVNSFATTRLGVPWVRCHELQNRTFLITELRFWIDSSTGAFMSETEHDPDTSCGDRSGNPKPVGLLPSRAPIV